MSSTEVSLNAVLLSQKFWAQKPKLEIRLSNTVGLTGCLACSLTAKAAPRLFGHPVLRSELRNDGGPFD